MNSADKAELLSQVAKLHEQDSFAAIIELLEPQISELEYEVALELARAYINQANTLDAVTADELYTRANSLLDKFTMQGKEHATYLFYKGYALFKLGLANDALIRFERALRFIRLGSEDAILPVIEKMKQLCESFDPDSSRLALSTEDEQILDQHIKEHFGKYQILLKTDRYEILHVAPTAEHPWNLIVTKGLSAKKVKVPVGVDELTNSRLELALCLPEQWEFTNSEQYNLWPINALCELINYILTSDEFIGFGYTFSNDKPWHQSTEFTGGMLTAMGGYNHRAQEVVLSDHSYVHFFEMIFLYPLEVAFRNSHDASALLELFIRRNVRPSPVRKRVDTCQEVSTAHKI